jgi:hypothetical protein
MPALTGDATSSAGSCATTNVKLNGIAFGATAAVDTVPVITASNTATYTALPNFTTGFLQYTTATHLFSCGSGVTSFNARTGAVVPASGDYNAGQITYTPQGTGGVATTDKAELDRTIWVNDYGAVCNGVTDDHVAFQNAINAGQSLGLPVKFIGTCAIAAGLAINLGVELAGVGIPASSGSSPSFLITAI